MPKSCLADFPYVTKWNSTQNVFIATFGRNLHEICNDFQVKQGKNYYTIKKFGQNLKQKFEKLFHIEKDIYH